MKETALSVFLCAAALAATSPAATVAGRFQTPGAVSRMSRESSGVMRMTIEAASLANLRGRDPADLSLEFDIRIVRSDGASGAGSLKLAQGGGVVLAEASGREVFKGGSPVAEGVAPVMRQAGIWMHASYPLAKMAPDSSPSVLFLSLYNDYPKNGVACGLSAEVRNARIVAAGPGARPLAESRDAKESADPATVCNPLDLNYMIQRPKQRKDGSFETPMTESADPAVVVFRGEYWLFASHGDGYWRSKDMGKWTFVPVDVSKGILSEFRRYAPATCVVGDWLYLTHSESGRIIRTRDPGDVSAWEDVGRPQGWMDPGMLYDDPATGGDGYVYLYKGLSHFEPIDVIKLDPNDGMKKVVPDNFHCAWPDRDNRGFEVPGDDSLGYGGKDTQEGPWPVKHGGRYYLSCAVPGTQYAGYCDNCYVADSPTGPFRLLENSPVVWKATGYARGAGHGALFEDLRGRWWKIDSCRRVGFDRRLVLFPASFDAKGALYVNAAMGDYPMFVPGRSPDPFRKPGPGWNLLSYGKTAVASSNSGFAALAFDEDMATAWTAATGGAGEWLAVDLGRTYAVRAVQVNFSTDEAKAGGRDNDWAFRYLAEYSRDGKAWYRLIDRASARTMRHHEYVEFDGRVGVRYLRLTTKGEAPAGARWAVNGLRVFGEGGGEPPAPVDVSRAVAERRAGNNRSAGISWPRARGAQGYVVRYGVSPDALHTHCQVFGSESAVLNTLIRGVDYYATIDSFNESGVTRGKTVVAIEATEGFATGPFHSKEYPSPAIANHIAGAKTFEAEEGRFGGSGVRPEYEPRASGAKALWGLGPAGTFAEFPGAWPGGGKASARIAYSAIADARISVRVGRRAAKEISLPKTRGWPTYETLDFELEGPSGAADVRIEGAGDRFHLDWIEMH